MGKTCRYIFKKGKRKGTLCGAPCTGTLDTCSAHAQVRSSGIVEEVIRRKLMNDETLKQRIMALPTTVDNKAVILKHYYNTKRVDGQSTEFYKNNLFVDTCLKVPWNTYYHIDSIVNQINIKTFIEYIASEFDRHIFGLQHVKNEIINYVCKFITNPRTNRNNIALCGPAGVGKTRFVNVLSKVLNIPLKTISLGGIKDSSFFLGHAYVYVESGPGKIMQSVIDSGVMNPMVYFDELDKVSETEGGKDVHAFLSYLTDPTQNVEYSDHYFYGMTFDLSKVFYVFTFNDISKVDKVLLDRLNIVYIQPPSDAFNVQVLSRYCMPEIVQNIGIRRSVFVHDTAFRTIYELAKSRVDREISSGVRESYRLLEKLLLELNKQVLLGTFGEADDPVYLDEPTFQDYLGRVITSVPSENAERPFGMYT